MHKELVPELHDILKLCESYKFIGVERRQSPHKNPLTVLKEAQIKGIDLDHNPSWFGVLKHHHANSFKLYPDTPDLFLLDMADSLAAAISRGENRRRLGYYHAYIKYGYDYQVFKLWKKYPEEVKRQGKVATLNLEEIFKFLSSNPSAEQLYKFAENSIYDRAEDAVIGANLTSLYTHSVLTGKFFRLLKDAPYFVSQSEIKKRTHVQKTYKDRISKWNFTISKLKIHFPQKPVRTKDMNIFKILNDTRERIGADFKDNIFFNTSDEILMVLTPNENIHMLKPYLDYGFWIEYSERNQLLKDLNPNPESIKEFKEGVVHKKLPSTKIELPICDICQKDKAEKEWVKDYILSMEICDHCKRVIAEQSWPPVRDNLCQKDLNDIEKWFDEKIGEDLCQNCFDIRICLPETRLKKLEEWSEKEENPKIIWIKVNLDFFELIKSLERLYARYLRDIGVPDFKDNVEIRFSVLSEFRKDYEEFLEKFELSLRDKFKNDMEIPILEDFFVLRIEALCQIIEVLKDYYNLFNNYFPQFKHLNDSPLKLSISCSNAKFPFFEHWEILQKPKNDVHITLIDKGEVKTSIINLEEILIRAQQMKTRANIRALHKLAEIAKLSEKLAEVALKDKSDKDYKTYKEIFPMGMDFNSLLTLAKIMEDQYEVP